MKLIQEDLKILSRFKIEFHNLLFILSLQAAPVQEKGTRPSVEFDENTKATKGSSNEDLMHFRLRAIIAAFQFGKVENYLRNHDKRSYMMLFVACIRDNYSKQRPDIENLFTLSQHKSKQKHSCAM